VSDCMPQSSLVFAMIFFCGRTVLPVASKIWS
jgi:hypothetical protein